MSSLRTTQAGRSIFAVSEQNGLLDSVPWVAQNITTAISPTSNNSVALIDSGLYIELTSAVCGGAALNAFYVTGTLFCTTSAAAGIQIQLTASDGLQVTSSALQYNFNAAAAGGPNVVTTAGAAATSGAVQAISVNIEGIVQVNGAGRLKVQFAQAVATAVATNITANSCLRGEAQMP